MDLKFSFSESNELPLSQTTTSTSSELFIDVADANHEELTAVAVSGDGVEYAKSARAVNENDEYATAVRSVIARVIAELGDPLSQSVTQFRVGTNVHLALQQLNAVDASGTKTTEVLERRAGVIPGTPVELAL
ncbi:MAG: hypothetical protein ACTJFR_04370 [Canibacter sp.]